MINFYGMCAFWEFISARRVKFNRVAAESVGQTGSSGCGASCSDRNPWARASTAGRCGSHSGHDGEDPDHRAMAILSAMVGAVLLSCDVNDERMSKRLLEAAAESALTASSVDGCLARPAPVTSRSSARSATSVLSLAFSVSISAIRCADVACGLRRGAEPAIPVPSAPPAGFDLQASDGHSCGCSPGYLRSKSWSFATPAFQSRPG